jgi:hypothetical protein
MGCQKLQFDEFVDLWVPRNAKALKCTILAGERDRSLAELIVAYRERTL